MGVGSQAFSVNVIFRVLNGPKNQANHQKDSEGGVASGSVTSESQTVPGEADASQANANPAATTGSG
jgi:hypothetical protein